MRTITNKNRVHPPVPENEQGFSHLLRGKKALQRMGGARRREKRSREVKIKDDKGAKLERKRDE